MHPSSLQITAMKQTDVKYHSIPLCVGYNSSTDEPFSHIVRTYKDAIGEVYYAFPDSPSGRSAYGSENGYKDYFAFEALLYDLKEIVSMGIKTDLLLNANCGGDDALSIAHERNVISILECLYSEGLCPNVVTTTSPVTARIIHNFSSEIDVRASVNMRISTIKGVQYLEDLFDSFCICRDINRCPDEFDTLSDYLKKQGKGISMLVNSGCLRNCSMQTFHDNAVAHEKGIMTKANLSWAGASGCRGYLSKKENMHAFLQNTWIRPEDVHNFSGKVDCIKLATRMHALPAMVIDAYARGRYYGNLADLFEPGHGPLFAPYVIDNERFPADWFERTTTCRKNCHECDYCKQVWEKVMVNTDH